MLPLVSTPAGTSGVFVGARHGQGFAVETTSRDPSRAVVLGHRGAARPRAREKVSCRRRKRKPFPVIICARDFAQRRA